MDSPNPEPFSQLFLDEARDLLDGVERLVMDLETQAAQPETLDALFRIFHTLKGSGAMFGSPRVECITHQLETLLDLAREGKRALDQELLDLVLECRDYLQSLLGSAPPSEDEDRILIERIRAGLDSEALDTSAELESETGANTPPKPSNHEPTPEDSGPILVYWIRYAPCADAFARGSDPAALVGDLLELGEGESRLDLSRLPSLGDADPERCHLSWDVLLATTKGQSAIEDLFIFDDPETYGIVTLGRRPETPCSAARQACFEALARRGRLDANDLPTAPGAPTSPNASTTPPPPAPPAAAPPPKPNGSASFPARETVRVATDRLDRLVNLVGELVVNQARLNQLSTSLSSPELSSATEEAERLIDDLRDNVLDVRMTQVGAAYQRFRRLTRDLANDLGKRIRFVGEGEDTELDKTVLDQLGDPIIHLLRNCCDHAIEPPEERQAAGKDPTGLVRLSAAQRGSQVVIAIRDDGRGIDRDRLRRKAVEKGLLAPDTKLSPQALLQLVFHPGLSTAASVSNVSGRGVGMDAVKSQIEALRGKIEIESEPGQGTEIRLFIPLTLAIIDGLLVAIRNDRYILPIELITETLELPREERLADNGRNLALSRGEAVPYIRLRELFDEGEEDAPGCEMAVILQSGEQRFGLVVDRVLGSRQTVIKSVGKLCRTIKCISGASILGDGRVALILDAQGILEQDAQRRLTG